MFFTHAHLRCKLQGKEIASCNSRLNGPIQPGLTDVCELRILRVF